MTATSITRLETYKQIDAELFCYQTNVHGRESNVTPLAFSSWNHAQRAKQRDSCALEGCWWKYTTTISGNTPRVSRGIHEACLTRYLWKVKRMDGFNLQHDLA